MRARGLRRVWSDFYRRPGLHLVSIATIAVALVLVGAFLVVFANVEMLAEKTNPKVTGTLYLSEGLSREQIVELRDQVFALEPVRQVVFKDRESVVNEIRQFLGESTHKSLPGSDIFPDVLELELEGNVRKEVVDSVQRTLREMPGIQEVDFSEGWLVQYRKIRRFTSHIGLALLVAIVFGCGFIIANFMGVRHQSRRQEIQIARMMGAHRGFILAPFIWEGIIEGVLGAAAALGTLYVGTIILSQVIVMEWGSLLGLSDFKFLNFAQGVGVVAVGMAMALVGSVLVFFRFQESAHA